MKYNLNINQFAVFNNPEFATLTLQDLVVFNFIKDFANTSSCKRNSDGFFWIKHTIVSDALPILGIVNEESSSRKPICRAKISQIMRKLCKVGLLAASPDNEAKGISEYAFGENYDKMIFAKDEQKNSNPCKNLQPPYQKNTTPPSKNLQGYNSNKDIIDIIDNRVSGDFQSPAAPQKAGDEKAEFSEWLHNNGFTRLSKTNFFLEKEKSCAKKEKLGDAGYLATLGAIDAYLGQSPKYLADKKDFARVFDKFAVSTDFITAKNDLNRVFSSKFKTPYTLRGKAADIGLNGVISQLDELGGDMPLQQKITGFFDALATLPKFDNPTAWKPAFINSDFSEIIALLKNSKTSQPSRGETYKERDARLAQEKRDAEKAALKESAAYDTMRAQIIRILDNGGELQPFHKESQPYKDMFGGDQTPF
jgi:hypothetical protein